MTDASVPRAARPRRSAGGGYRRALAWILAGATVVLVTFVGRTPPPRAFGQESGAAREFAVSARRYRFTPSRLEVREGDLVTIRFSAEDIAHSFTIDAYRIAKRANPGQTVTFEFRADRVGTFPYYCNLTIDEGCREMRGELVVRPR
jgi:heme/copper-type cytochrome/quinol oxidase subunit 2